MERPVPDRVKPSFVIIDGGGGGQGYSTPR